MNLIRPVSRALLLLLVALQAKILLVSGRLPEAKIAAQRAVQLGPRDADAWTMQASVAHAGGDLNTALQGYGRALELRPDQLEARLARVGLLGLMRMSRKPAMSRMAI